MAWLSRGLAGFALLLGAASSLQAQWVTAHRDEARADLNVIFFVDDKNGWVIGDRGLLRATHDGGGKWFTQDAKVSANLSDILFRNKEEGWLIAGAHILRSQDGGDTWEQLYQIPVPPGARPRDAPELYSVAFPSKKRGWVVGTDGRILHTGDGGRTWAPQESGTKEELVHVKFVNDRRGWVVGGGGTILFTDDGGRTWEPQRSGTEQHLYHVEAQGKERAWVVGDQGTILRTTNAGVSWEAIVTGTKETPMTNWAGSSVGGARSCAPAMAG
jgi:photosystem II stability/assembly factor-like uncharacterized protein